LRQINWDHLYDVNSNSNETLQDANGIQGNSYTGLRAHYLLEERVAGLKRLDIQSVYNTRPGNVFGFSGGGSVQIQQTHYYKKINDLLGAEYSVDWNQFAERDFPNNASVIQNDLELSKQSIT
jgi:hypothetical protein